MNKKAKGFKPFAFLAFMEYNNLGDMNENTG